MESPENKGILAEKGEDVTQETKPVVMIIDDDRFNLSYLGDLIASLGYESVKVQKSLEVMPTLEKTSPDIILLDVVMPDIDGYTICKMIKENEETSDIPVLFITSLSETSQIVKGFDVGGIDYVTKPFRPEELSARVRTHIELRRSKKDLYKKNEQLNTAYLQIESKNKELHSMMKWFEDVSNKDHLTGIYNRRFMMKMLAKEKARSLRHGVPYCVLLCDIDKFKNINDTHGHDFGDFVLVETAALIESAIRTEDTLSRWGGEEFLILLPSTMSSNALLIAERIRTAVEEKSFQKGDITYSVTVSIGVGESMGDEDIDATIKKSDLALYECKKTGRNKALEWTPFLEKINHMAGEEKEDWIGKPKMIIK